MNYSLDGSSRIGRVAVLLLASCSLTAQSPGTGAIAGSVIDPSGAVLPKATVSVVNDATHAVRTVVSSAEGSFRVPLLPPGDYSISAQATGFAIREMRAVHVGASETATVELRLAVGAANQTLEVSAASDLAQTESSTLGRTVDEKIIQELPLANRNYTQIVALSPGVVVEVPNAAALGRNSQNVSANGNKTTSNNFQFNGIDANNLSQNSATGYQSEVGTAIPAPDTIEEFKVQTGGFDAGYGRSAGANVDVISKTGGNRWHGSLWEFLRNDALNANDFFAKKKRPKSPGFETKSVWRYDWRADSTRQDLYLWCVPGFDTAQWRFEPFACHSDPAATR